MKDAPYSAPPVAGSPDEKLTFREMLRSQRKNDRFYQATDRETGTWLLWMECRRFGDLRAFPCAISTAEGERLYFDSAPASAAEERNSELMRRWEALRLPERKAALDIEPLEEKEFRELYRRSRSAVGTDDPDANN